MAGEAPASIKVAMVAADCLLIGALRCSVAHVLQSIPAVHDTLIVAGAQL